MTGESWDVSAATKTNEASIFVAPNELVEKTD